MNHQTYMELRTEALAALAPYMGTERGYAVKEILQFIGGPTAGLKHERDAAMRLYACEDLTPQERAAAHLLAVVSNHRAITWWREPDTPDGSPPLPPLKAVQVKKLREQTQDALAKFAARLPEREADVLSRTLQNDIGLPPMNRTAATADRGRHMKRNALIDANRSRWKSIERDLKDGAENGLSAAAKSDRHSFWWEDSALQWAEENGKLQAPAGHELVALVHRMRG